MVSAVAAWVAGVGVCPSVCVYVLNLTRISSKHENDLGTFLVITLLYLVCLNAGGFVLKWWYIVVKE